MTLAIFLTPEQQRKLAERAARSGQDVASYVVRLIERDIRSTSDVGEALTPFRRQIEESGMSDEDLDAFFEDVREEVWHEKHGKGAAPAVCPMDPFVANL